jgi:putative tryptophan/tyrosine transport system substrate-binding protein
MELSFHPHLACFRCWRECPNPTSPRQRSRLDSERLRLAHRTPRPLCGSLRVRQSDCGGDSPVFDVRRREFISLLGGAAAWPLATRAALASEASGQRGDPIVRVQQMPVIGYLSSGSPQGFTTRLAAFRRGLQETGYREGQNVAIDYRWAEGKDDRLPAMAADLAQRGVNVLAAPGGISAARAAKGATATIPIVFETGADPVASGLVASLSRPDGNVTGVTSLNVEVGPKRFELLRQLAPTASAVAMLVNPGNPNSQAVIAESRRAARTLNLELHLLQAGSDGDFDTAFTKLAELRAGGLVVAPDPFFINRSGRLAALTVRHAVVAIFHTREFVAAGGLLSYGGSTAESHRQAGRYAGRILKGDKPADLPIQQVTKVELFINANTAKALGLEIPPTLLALADEVIE